MVATTFVQNTAWVTFGPGQKVMCPCCGTRLGTVGEGFKLKLRPNPAGRMRPPSPGVPYSEHCRRCDVNLERKQEAA